jgi:hypothetical protein
LGGRVEAFDDEHIVRSHVSVVPVLMIGTVPHPVLLTLVLRRYDICGDELRRLGRPVVAQKKGVILDRRYQRAPYTVLPGARQRKERAFFLFFFVLFFEPSACG